MVQQICTWFSTRRANKIRQNLLLEHKVILHGFGGLVVAGLVVSEFGYLLNFISDGLIRNFDDLYKIKDNSQMLLQQIDRELDKPILREQESLGLPRATAVENMVNLRTVIQCIQGYVASCDAARIVAQPS